MKLNAYFEGIVSMIAMSIDCSKEQQQQKRINVISAFLQCNLLVCVIRAIQADDKNFCGVLNT